jgi:hypothetical protein
MELAVLRSGAALIDVHRPLLYVEVFTDQLARYGTTVADLDPFLTARRYVFFRNGGPRNSTSDDFAISYLPRLADGGPFFDCLAVPLERIYDEPALAAVPERPRAPVGLRLAVALRALTRRR